MPLQKVNYEFQPSLFALEDVVEPGLLVSPEEAQRRSLAAQQALQCKDELPPWYEEYQRLLEGNWPWRVAAYIAWAASPRGSRWPETQDKLAAEVLGLTSDRQIATWRRRNPSIADMIAALQVAPMLEHRADVIQALINSAKDPDYKSHQDRKLFLEITGDFIPSSKLDAIINRSAGSGVEGESTADLIQSIGE